MINLNTIFNAGRVRRWHSNAEMSWTEDYNDAHQGRVARLLLALHPKPSQMLIAAALTHDDGESFTGDMSFDAKKSNPQLRTMLKQAEDAAICVIWGLEETPHFRLSDDEKEWLEFADRLDSYMWTMHKLPRSLNHTGWARQREELLAFAEKKDILECLLFLN